MLTVESANKGRNGVLWFVGALICGAGAACFTLFMGGTLGIILAGVSGLLALSCGVVGLVQNWKQSKKERDAQLAYHQSGTANNIANIIDKVVDVSKSVSKKETKQQTKEEDTKSVSTQASDDISKTAKIVSKIIKEDGTTTLIDGPLNDAAAKNLKLFRKIIKITEK
jgi:hypothetical protein